MSFNLSADDICSIQGYSEIYQKETIQQHMDKYVENIFNSTEIVDNDVINVFQYFVPIIFADIDYSIDIEEMKKALIPGLKKIKYNGNQNSNISYINWIDHYVNRENIIKHEGYVSPKKDGNKYYFDKNTDKLYLKKIEYLDFPSINCHCFNGNDYSYRELKNSLKSSIIHVSNLIIDSWKRYDNNWSKKNSIELSKTVSVMSHKILDLEETIINNQEYATNKIKILESTISNLKDENINMKFQINNLQQRLNKIVPENVYDYESMKETKKEMHREFKRVYKIFRRLLDLRYNQ